MRQSRLALALLPLVLLAASQARAEASDATARVHAPSPGSDGVYGRLDGSVAISAGLGAELEGQQPRGQLRLAAHYWWTAGIYARYSDAFGTAERHAGRVVSFGVDVRPLFLPRFALDSEQGPALWDLTLDSLSLSAGAYLASPPPRPRELEPLPRQHFGDERGFETGLGLAAPLFGSARGLWLDARAERRFADRGPSAWLFTLGLSFHLFTRTATPDPP
jgi:hypothetical protein